MQLFKYSHYIFVRQLDEQKAVYHQHRSDVGAQIRSQPILRWAIAQPRILRRVAYLKMG